MKYAFMSFSCPELELEAMLLLAKRYGYDGVEPRLNAGHRHGVETNTTGPERKQIKKVLEKTDAAICCLATSCSYANPATSHQQIEETKRMIELAADIGTPVIRVFGTNQSGFPMEEAYGNVAASLKALAGFAARENVTVCLETHDDWCNPQEVARLMREVGHPAIAVNWDIMHTVRDGGMSVEKGFEMLQPWIRHVHVHDAVDCKDRMIFKPMGEGDFDHRTAVRLLKKCGYEGFLSGEWMVDWKPEEFLPKELCVLKSYEND